MNVAQLDVAVCIGLIVMGVIACFALAVGGPGGLTVAGTTIGGIAGWLTRGAVNKLADRITAPDATVNADGGGGR